VVLVAVAGLELWRPLELGFSILGCLFFPIMSVRDQNRKENVPYYSKCGLLLA